MTSTLSGTRKKKRLLLRGARARRIVALQSGRRDGPGHGLAAGAAKLALRTEDERAMPARLEDGKPAVEAVASIVFRQRDSFALRTVRAGTQAMLTQVKPPRLRS